MKHTCVGVVAGAACVGVVTGTACSFLTGSGVTAEGVCGDETGVEPFGSGVTALFCIAGAEIDRGTGSRPESKH